MLQEALVKVDNLLSENNNHNKTNEQTKHHNSLLSENNLDQKYHPRSVGTAAEGIYPNLLSTELVLSLCIYF